MKLTVLSSSSKGNGYILRSSTGETLLIEAGVKLIEVKKALDFDVRQIVGCLVSHEHGDHAKYHRNYYDNGINLYMSNGTADILGYISKWFKGRLKVNYETKIGNFRVIPFSVKHDAAEPLGFLINHTEMGNLLFATDTYYLPNKFKNLNNILIEANYSEPILTENVQNGLVSAAQQERTMFSHLSLENCIKTLNANDLSKVNNIVLIHLSDNNSHAENFKNAVKKATVKTVVIAKKDLTMEFDKLPF
jgi:phosphoribosyl 1,2-cyclic phosphodiesterase